MNKNKGKPKQHIHYGKGNKGQTVENKDVSKSKVTGIPEPASTIQSLPVDFNKEVTLVFHATDTLFFRESRPMEALGEAQSVFPPPVRTLAGAVRTLMGEHFKVQWNEFDQQQGEHPLAAYIGHGESLGNLRFRGAWLAYNQERLYPAPLHLMRKGDTLFPLSLDTKTVQCDWGEHVRLPKLPDGEESKGSKPLENTWLSASAFLKVLQGEGQMISFAKPSAQESHIQQEVFSATDLFERESRLGIARDNASRTVEKSLLYQTQHIRPKDNLSIELDVEGLPPDMPTQAIIRLGGEGRTANFSLKQMNNTFPTININNTSTTFALYLLTPYYGSPCLDLHRKKCDPTVWQGEVNGIALTLHGAVTGKVQRVGGWDMAANKPRPVRSLIPAGSVFFCSVASKDDIPAAMGALHNKHIGEFTEYGYGHLAVGVWNDQ